MAAAARLNMLRWSVYNHGMSSKQMQEPTFLILTSLAAGPQHGYGVMTDVTQISGGRVRLRAGTLYAALDRLSTERLLEVDREEVVDTRLRRYYRLTPAGRARLAAETARLRANVAVAAQRLGLTVSFQRLSLAGS
jgi:DNA-binding PadR family transcriptional regulator